MTYPPDWKDATQYPDESALPQQWAWEFLRRNHDYRHDYQNGNLDYLRCKQYGITFERYKDNCIEKWAHDPNDNAAPDFLLACSPLMMHFVGGDQPSLTPEKGQVAVLFDLNYPLEKQFEIAKFQLDLDQKYLIQIGEIEKNNPRHRWGLLVEYLRILDATEKGEETAVIAATIFPLLNNEYPVLLGSDRVRKYLNKAKYYRDGGYRAIILTATIHFPSK